MNTVLMIAAAICGGVIGSNLTLVAVHPVHVAFPCLMLFLVSVITGIIFQMPIH